MALITCKRCGNRVSTLAEACPKCGCPVSESMATQSARQSALSTAEKAPAETASPASKDEQRASASNVEQTVPSRSGQSPKGKEPKHIPWVTITLVFILLLVAGSGYLLYDKHQKAIARKAAIAEQHRLDSIAEVKAEAERAEAARQDSLRKVNMTTSDLTVFDLHGDVKSVNKFNIMEETYTITSDGTLLTSGNQTISRDSQGRFINLSEKQGHTIFSCKWHNNKPATIKYYELYAYNLEYDNNGFAVKCNYVSDIEFDCCSNIVYSDYIVDEVGNWIQRTCYEKDYTTLEYGGCDEERTYIEERTITYYTHRESKRYTLKEYLALKNQ